MTVRLGDVQVRSENLDAYVALRILEQNAFWNAGVVVTNPLLDQHASSGQGQLIEIPHFNPIGNGTEPNVGSDDPASLSTPQGVGTGKQTARKLMLNQSWSSMDIVPALIGPDPLSVLGDQVADYWTTVLQNYLISCAVGVLADNEANDGADMLYDGGANPISAEMVIRARQTMGDRKRNFTAIAMHSAVYARLEEDQLITFIRGADNNTLFPTFNGLTVVEDDALPTDGTDYISVLFGPGAFSYGNGSPKTPFETDRTPAAGDGEGQETFYSRRHFTIHPNGFNNTSNPAGQSATRAELEVAGSWDRIYDRKRCNMAFLRSQV